MSLHRDFRGRQDPGDGNLPAVPLRSGHERMELARQDMIELGLRRLARLENLLLEERMVFPTGGPIGTQELACSLCHTEVGSCACLARDFRGSFGIDPDTYDPDTDPFIWNTEL